MGKGSCKFETCAYKHDPNKINKESVKETNSNFNETIENIDYIDYDNFDSDDDSDEIESREKFVRLSEHSCDKCNYKTKSKIHLAVHIKSCHKIIEVNKEKIVVPKKRKTIEENEASRKKTKEENKSHTMSLNHYGLEAYTYERANQMGDQWMYCIG